LNYAKGWRCILDIGASDGYFSREMSARGQHVFAIEKHLAHVPALSASKAWLWMGDAFDALMHLDLRGQNSMALCCEVLEHMTRGEAIGLLSMIKADTLLVTVPNANSDVFGERSRRDWPDHKQTFTSQSLESLLRAGGWSRDGGGGHYIGLMDEKGPFRSESIWIGMSCKPLR
jgi:hypothetical protein